MHLQEIALEHISRKFEFRSRHDANHTKYRLSRRSMTCKSARIASRFRAFVMHRLPAHGRNSSLWLALRAGVLLRAVSQTARPVFRPGEGKICAGRVALRTGPTGSQFKHRCIGSRNAVFPVNSFTPCSKQCGLTIRSTGPIAAGRHLGYKSLAKTPARRNRPDSSNV